jgi:hypothetical protein
MKIIGLENAPQAFVDLLAVAIQHAYRSRRSVCDD